MYRIMILLILALCVIGCSERESLIVSTDEADETDKPEPVSFVGGSENEPSYYSEHHIDGWLTDNECVASLENVFDVLRLGKLIQGYEGEGLILDEEFGQLRFLTIEEVGLSENPNVKHTPNGIYTAIISETDWVGLKAYVEAKL